MNDKQKYIDTKINNIKELKEYILKLKEEKNNDIKHILVNFEVHESSDGFKVKNVFPLHENGILISTSTTIDIL